MFMRLDSVSAGPGEVIISQGEEGEHFYIISKGKCKVTRKEGDSDEEKMLAELNVGDSFGEEALLSSSKRNATVTMITGGTVMRLKRSDFEELLKEPIVKYVDYAEALALVEKGYLLLDVRLESEHENECIEGSINIPLNMIRNEIENLSTDVQYIVYCDTGSRSATAAFLLNEHGIKAMIIQGGLRSQNSA
jgi:CRP-like cAMP-binding protein